jgi:hypothetical protein
MGRIQTTHSATAQTGGWRAMIVTRERMRHSDENFFGATPRNDPREIEPGWAAWQRQGLTTEPVAGSPFPFIKVGEKITS